MLAAAATSSLFPVPSSLDVKSTSIGSGPMSLGAIKSKTTSSGGLKVKANAQAPPKIDGSSVSLETAVETVKIPDWRMLLGAITTVVLAAEKEWMMPDCKERRADMLVDPFVTGKILQDGFVFRQNFSIKSYEIGADRTASIETLMKNLQETALNHSKTVGLLADGFGSTPEMSKRNLIWVVARMQVLVDRYPTWGDVVEVDTWVSASGKNGMRRDWLLRDAKTGQIMTKASGVCVMMNKLTRRLSKIPEEVKGEIEPYFLNSDPVVAEDRRKLPKLDENTANHIQKDLTARWSDLDVNQHVNNVKYIGWILECVPQEILESHDLASMTLEYMRECEKNSVVQSLTDVSGAAIGNSGNTGEVECQHLLRLNSGAEILRARTEWRPKHAMISN